MIKKDKEPYEKNYYEEWRTCIYLLRKAHGHLGSIVTDKSSQYGKKLDLLIQEIEDVI